MIPPLGATGTVVYSHEHPPPHLTPREQRDVRERHDGAASRGHPVSGCHTNQGAQFVELVRYTDPDTGQPVLGVRTRRTKTRVQLVRYTDPDEAHAAYRAAADNFHRALADHQA